MRLNSRPQLVDSQNGGRGTPPTTAQAELDPTLHLLSRIVSTAARQRVGVALLVALTFLAIAQTPAPALTASHTPTHGAAVQALSPALTVLSSPAAGATEERVLLPFALVAHSPRQLEAWLPGGVLAEFVREGDILYLVSGNNARPLDVAWVNESAARLKRAYPAMDVYVLTAGLANVRALAARASDDVDAIGYGYEPNMRNEPEFSWDSGAVSASMATVGDVVRAAGRQSFAMPTGRAMLPRDQRGAFDYRTHVGSHVDRVFVQAQAHCQRHDFATGVRDVIGQFGDNASQAWFQVTVDPSDVNGVTASRAAACISEALSHGPAGILFWWASKDVEEARRFLSGRDAFVVD